MELNKNVENKNLLGVKLSEKKKEFTTRMAKYTIGDEIPNEEKVFLASLSDDIEFLEKQLETNNTMNSNTNVQIPLDSEKRLMARQIISTPTAVFEKNEKGTLDAIHAGEFIVAVAHPVKSVRDEYGERVKQHYGVSMDELQRGITYPGERRDLAETSNTEGGVFVPQNLSSLIINQYVNYSMAKFALRFPMTGPSLTVPKLIGSGRAYWVNENNKITQSQIKTDNFKLEAKELAYMTYYSNSLSDDALVNISQIILQRGIYAAAFAIDEALVNGGSVYEVNPPSGIRGLIQAFTEDTTGVVSATAGSSANWNLITINDITNLITTTTPLPGADEAFFCTKQFFGQVLLPIAAKAGGNRLDILAKNNLNLDNQFDTPQGMFMNYPVYFSPAFARASGKAQIVCGFGTLNLCAAIGDRAGIQVSTNNLDTQSWQNYQTSIRILQRTDVNIYSTSIYDADNTTLLPGGFAMLQTT